MTFGSPTWVKGAQVGLLRRRHKWHQAEIDNLKAYLGHVPGEQQKALAQVAISEHWGAILEIDAILKNKEPRYAEHPYTQAVQNWVLAQSEQPDHQEGEEANTLLGREQKDP